jgi:hypothetical protein
VTNARALSSLLPFLPLLCNIVVSLLWVTVAPASVSGTSRGCCVSSSAAEMDRPCTILHQRR